MGIRKPGEHAYFVQHAQRFESQDTPGHRATILKTWRQHAREGQLT